MHLVIFLIHLIDDFPEYKCILIKLHVHFKSNFVSVNISEENFCAITTPFCGLVKLIVLFVYFRH